MKTRSSKNNSNNNAGGDEQPQLRRSERKRKLNKLSNDGKPAAGEDQPGPEKEECSSKNSRHDGRNDQQDLEQIVQLPQVTGDGEKEIADENEEQAELPISQPMKIQMSKETWFDMLEFVGRRQLGQIVPQVGDRRFARIVQPFLHNYGRITLAEISIYASSHRLIRNSVEIPENAKDFLFISLSYLNTPVINFLQKFQQNSLFGNVNLHLRLNIDGENTNTFLQPLAHILPSIDNINSIRGRGIGQLSSLHNANNEMAKAMLKMARFLDIDIDYEDFNFPPNETEFLIRWLHTPRDDGKPRVLVLPLDFSPSRPIRLIIDVIIKAIKSEFEKAKLSAYFFIRLFVRDTVDWHDSSMENLETKEKLVIKKVATTGTGPTYDQGMALISRYPLGAGKRWIEANEREALDWDFHKQNGRICLGNTVRNEIDNPDVEAEEGPPIFHNRNSNYGDQGGFLGLAGAGGQGR